MIQYRLRYLYALLSICLLLLQQGCFNLGSSKSYDRERRQASREVTSYRVGAESFGLAERSPRKENELRQRINCIVECHDFHCCKVERSATRLVFDDVLRVVSVEHFSLVL